MNKISINLLPSTVLLERVQSSRLSLINKLSIVVLVLVMIITLAVLALHINQNRENERIMGEVKAAESKVLALRNKEASAFALKNRLDAIYSKLGTDEKVKTMFNLIVYLTPPEVTLTDVAVDKNGSVTASFNSNSLTSIDKLLLGLSGEETNLDLVSKVDMTGISLSKDSAYKFSLRVVGKN